MEINLIKFYDALKDNKLEFTTEEYLFMVNIDFHHLISLIWSKNTRKSTDSYKVFLLSECIKNLVYATMSSNLDVSNIEKEVNICYNYFNSNFKSNEIDKLITTFNRELEENYDTINIIGIACYLINSLVPCSWEDVYNSQKFENNKK